MDVHENALVEVLVISRREVDDDMAIEVSVRLASEHEYC